MNQDPDFIRPEPVLDSPRKPPNLELYMPATPPLGVLSVIEFWLHIYWRRAHFRRLFRPLLAESDCLLADIGFHREDVEWAMTLPLRADALKALNACRQARQEAGQPTAPGDKRSDTVLEAAT